ncbi:MAG: hypothetical protein ACLFQB_05900 [Chitinispirillaceae bacterium]
MVPSKYWRLGGAAVLTVAGIVTAFVYAWWAGAIMVAFGGKILLEMFSSDKWKRWISRDSFGMTKVSSFPIRGENLSVSGVRKFKA